MLLELLERVRIALLRRPVIGKKYKLDESKGIDVDVIPDDTAPFFAAEMSTEWILPPVPAEDIEGWLL